MKTEPLLGSSIKSGEPVSNRKKVYLAGGIAGLKFEDAAGWRDVATRHFARYQVEAISPLCLEGAVYTHLNGGVRPEHENELTYDVPATKYIVWKDLEIIKQCQGILVNAARPSWGTAMEIFFAAHVLNKPVVSFGNPDERSPWVLNHVVGIRADLASACDFMIEIFKYGYA